MDQIGKHIIFAGRVQGVGFRFTALRIASRYELTGFVRNLPNGSVEMLAQGNLKDIADCIDDIQETFQGSIRETQENDVPYNGQYVDFKITF
ncbi:MAG: acylphosphatase [Phycisphaerales bacterium]|jgi:acylphosphatase